MFRPANIVYALRELIARKGRSGAAIAGMSAGVALYVAFATLSAGYTKLIRLPFSQLSVDVTIQRPSTSQEGKVNNGVRMPFSNQPIRKSDAASIAAIPEIEASAESLILWDQSPKGFVIIQGIDPSATTIGPAKVQEWLAKGRKLNGEGREVLLEEHFARFNGKKINDVILLGGKPFTIVGVVALKEGSTVSSANAYMTIDNARALVGVEPDIANMVFAKIKRGTDSDIVRKKVATKLPDVIVSSSDNIGDMMKGFTAISGGFSTVMGMLSLLFAAIVTYRILVGSVNERAPEIGIMKAVGWKRSDITFTLMTESFAVGLAGGLLGVILGYLCALGLASMKVSLAMPWNLSPVPSGAGHSVALNVHSVALPVNVSLTTIGVALAVSAVISALTGAVIAGKTARVKVMETLRAL